METGLKATLINVVIVGSGGFIGAISRYGLSGLIHRQIPFATFPYGTLVVNLVGCFAIGIVAGLADNRQMFGPEIRAFALIGILGGFTTYSTFGYETFEMVRDTEFLHVAVNVAMHVLLGLALVWLGYSMTSMR